MAATSCGEVEKVAGVYRMDLHGRTSDSACYRSVLDRFSPQGVYNKKRNFGSQASSLVVVPTKFLVGGFTGGHWFITSP